VKALVIGGSGQLGRCLVRVLSGHGVDVCATYYSRAAPQLMRVDVRSPEALDKAAADFKPDVILLTSDVPATRRAQVTTQDEDARGAIVDGALNVARAARRFHALLVLYSSPDVFSDDALHQEGDEPKPCTAHGTMKAEAEARVRAEISDHIIVRTSDLFGWDRTAQDMVQIIERHLRSGGSVSLPSSARVQPTLVDYVAEATLRLAQSEFRGTIHLAGSEILSQCDFGRVVARTIALDPDAVEAGGVDGTPRGFLDASLVQSTLGTVPMQLTEATKRLRRQWRADTFTGIVRASVDAEASRLRDEIFERVERYYELVHKPRGFIPFESRVNYAGRHFDAAEMLNLADSMLDFWLTLGSYGDLFESKMKRFLGCRDFALVNSGSSANLVGVSTLASPLVANHLEPGDEVITPAVTFPTTLAPILQNGLVPVFVDCELGTYNADANRIEDAISPRTRAIVLPHTLGNPFDLDAVCDIAARHHLWLMEDTCDALGSTFDGRPVGTFGDLGTLSFYPAHHITMGEGGGVIVNRQFLTQPVRSIRDWGRDCWCAPGESNTCAKRFGWCLGELPPGYDHKYIYSAVGFNLKPTEMQAAIGAAQIDKLPAFVERRRHNFRRLYNGLQRYADRIFLPTWHAKANPAWFGFPITVRGTTRRDDLVQWLENANIETRLVFAGNILRQPGYRAIAHRVAGTLENSDRVMRDTFFVGVYPGITDEMVDFMLDRFRAFFER